MLNVMQQQPSGVSDRLSILQEVEILNKGTTIDPEIAQLITDLNKAGHETDSSCQGKRNQDDVLHHGHCNHAYVGFQYPVPINLRRKANKMELNVYNGNLAIAALDGFETTWEEIFRKNKAFEARMRELFQV